MSSVEMLMLGGGLTTVDGSAIQDLRAALHGELLLPSDAPYDGARAVWNGLIDRRPALIARCSGPADVMVAVRFARERGLLVSVRGGAHNVSGNAVCHQGLMIDLSAMRGVRVDPTARTARAQGGVTWGGLDHETQVYALATPGGVVSDTGIAGLTLGGGLGWLRSMYGLSCDNLRSADVVTADARMVTASAEENPDLLWALRGGGGNFGVVTSFEYDLHPVGPMVMLVLANYAGERAAQVLRGFREFLAGAPPEVTSLASLWFIPDEESYPEDIRGRPALLVGACYAGPVDEGERAYSAPSSHTNIDVWPMGPGVLRFGAGDAVFGRRDARYAINIEANWSDHDATERNVAWAREFWEALRPLAQGGVYPNFPGLTQESLSVVRASYPGTFERLVELKRRYDPDNLFRMNLNIPPVGTPVTAR